MDSNFSVKITADISELQARLKSVEALTGKFQQSMDSAAGATKHLEQNANRGRMVAFAFGQVIRDAGFFANSFSLGILAISNNIPILIDQLSLSIKALQPFAGALSLIGSLLTAGLTIWAYSSQAIKQNKQSLDEWRSSLNDSTESQLKGAQAAQEEIVKLNILYKAATNAANATKTRNDAVKQLQDLYPSVFGNMDAEEIKLGKVSGAYLELRNSIQEAAFAEAAKNKIVENANRILDNQIRISEARSKIIKLNAELTKAEADATNEFNRAQKSLSTTPGKEGVDPMLRANKLANDVLNIKQRIAEQDKIIYDATGDTNILLGRNNDLYGNINQNLDSYIGRLKDGNKELEKSNRLQALPKGTYAKPAYEVGRLKGPFTGNVKKVDLTKPVREFTDLQLMIFDMIPTVGEMMQSIVSTIGNGFADVISSFSDGLAQLISGDMNIGQFGQSIIRAIGTFLSQLGKQLAAFGAATVAYGIAQKVLQSPSDPASKIAAGGALIAAGIALSTIGGLISRTAGGGGSGGGNRSKAPSTPTSIPSFSMPTTFQSSMAMSSGIIAQTSISGNDLSILVKRADKNRNAYYG